jgi:hypothetical protein
MLAAAVVLSAVLAHAQAPATQPAAAGAQGQPERFALTVYSSADPASFNPKGNPDNPGEVLPGYGVVREIRSIDLAAGLSTLRFTDVASGIDPTTVSFTSLTDPAGTSVLEQNYEFDLVSSAKLLEKYLDKEVIIERSLGQGKSETITGKLLSAEQGLVLQLKDGTVRVVNGYTGVQLASSAGLITKPTLVWQLSAKQAGKHDAQVTYQTDGLTWRADYNIVLDASDTKADIGAWVTVVNKSGASYPDTRLKLVAGDVQRVQPVQMEEARKDGAFEDDKDAAFAEKSFFEYHLYTLGRTTTLPNNSTKQIELFDARTGVPAEKVYVYYGVPEEFRFTSGGPFTDREFGTEMNKKVDTYIRIQNSEKSHLGIPLPAGRIRVYKRDDADKNLEFIGEDIIQHTPKDEAVLIKLGSAFDVVGERKQTDFKVDVRGHVATETFEIKVRNHKKEKITVVVKENLYRYANWEITAASEKWEKQDVRTIHIPIEVAPDAEKAVTYTVKYTW